MYSPREPLMWMRAGVGLPVEESTHAHRHPLALAAEHLELRAGRRRPAPRWNALAERERAFSLLAGELDGERGVLGAEGLDQALGARVGLGAPVQAGLRAAQPLAAARARRLLDAGHAAQVHLRRLDRRRPARRRRRGRSGAAGGAAGGRPSGRASGPPRSAARPAGRGRSATRRFASGRGLGIA